MIDKRFQIVESNFERLRLKFVKGELSREQFAESLRKLRIFDDQGRCWMLGAQSGQWYFYDGKDWVKAEPLVGSLKARLCPVCGQENEAGAEVCLKCQSPLILPPAGMICPDCGSRLEEGRAICPFCGAAIKPGEERQKKDEGQQISARKMAEGAELCYLQSADYLSFLLFFGGLGILLGILFGLMAGATEFFPGLASLFPAAFQEMQGKLVGGLVFSFFGGILGFVVMAGAGFILAFLINASIYFFGGPGFRLKKLHSRSK
ncbi:MAG: zinc ribbon domain-containing protein [Acidobacteriota bacterium]|nr:zinc ribbon domain-containing protein [Acidobacteriota bacterium]